MNSPLFQILNVVVTPWKLIGYFAVLLFAGRWIVQMLATRAAGKPVIPVTFWSMSLAGSGLLCAYFIWGRSDSVGLIANVFPMGVAIYNLVIDWQARRASDGQSPPLDATTGAPVRESYQ